jgi:hypothetical protein
MHDFDKERRERHEEREAALGDRSFTFAGRKFTYAANPSYKVTQSVAAMTAEMEGSAVFDTLESAVINMLDVEHRESFREAVSGDAEDAVTFEDLTTLANWLIGKQAERPPTQPESSAPTQRTTGKNSTENSSDEQAAA